MDFPQAVKSAYKNCFKYEGRASRSEFWWFYLYSVLLIVAIFVIIGVVGGLAAGAASGRDTTASSMIGGSAVLAAFAVYFLAIFFPMLSLAFRRLHDSDKSGWFLLLYFVPFGGIVLLVFYCLPGTLGGNRYGPDPKATPVSVANTFS